jgi:hypothetical protein
MRWAVRARSRDESGVVLVIFAIVIVVLLGMVAIAIDGSYGFVQNRRAQNAADFAAFAAAQELNGSAYCNGTSLPTTEQIVGIVQDLVQANGSGIGTNWTAQFLNSAGHSIGSFSSGTGPATPPPGACGISVNARPTWTPFFAGIFGIHKFGGFASGSVANVVKGPPIGIVSLNEVGPHAILGGGTGTFTVSGNIFLNTAVNDQPWTSSSGGVQWDDGIDAKADSNLYVYGNIDTVNSTYNGESLWPLDHCFQDSGVLAGTATGPTAPGGALPNERPVCTVGSVTVDYNSIDNSYAQITDPLQATDAPANPLNVGTNVGCPGYNGNVPETYDSVSQASGATTQLLPGIYPNPVELTGSVNFQDCSGYPDEAAYPGVYEFQGGLWINPQSSTDTVTGSNVVIATQNPYPLAGNVPGSLDAQGNFTATGSGNGAPCLKLSTVSSTASGGVSETTTPGGQNFPCSGTSPTTYGALAYTDKPIALDTSIAGTGNNFSLMIGGVAGATVDLSGPTTGPYAGVDGSAGVVFYQDPATQTNYGFDAETGDAATIKITGVVYNASLSNYGNNSPQDYWDGTVGGIPFYAGGTLQTGFGAGWSDGPAQSTGSVTLNGTAIVDDFNTDGQTDITILGQPYEVPGSTSLSLIG